MIEITDLPDTLDQMVGDLEVRTMLRATRQQHFVIAGLTSQKDEHGRRIVRYYRDGNGFQARIWSGAKRFTTKGEAQTFLDLLKDAYRRKARVK